MREYHPVSSLLSPLYHLAVMRSMNQPTGFVRPAAGGKGNLVGAFLAPCGSCHSSLVIYGAMGGRTPSIPLPAVRAPPSRQSDRLAASGSSVVHGDCAQPIRVEAS